MPTTKGYSVSITEGGTTNSGVYSYSGNPAGLAHCGRNGAYDHPTAQGLTEARIPTLMNGSRAVVNHDVTAIASIVTAGDACPGIDSATDVVATTTTLTGSGAGLIVSFTTTAAGVINGTAGNYTIEEGGESYATGDRVSIDGFPNSVVTVTAA